MIGFGEMILLGVVGVFKVLLYGIVIFGVWKIFMVSRDTKEIKSLLKDIKETIDKTG